MSRKKAPSEEPKRPNPSMNSEGEVPEGEVPENKEGEVPENKVGTLIDEITYVAKESLTSHPAFPVLMCLPHELELRCKVSKFHKLRSKASGFHGLSVDNLIMIIEYLFDTNDAKWGHPYDQAMNGMKSVFKRDGIKFWPSFEWPIPSTHATVNVTEQLWKGERRDLIVSAASNIKELLGFAMFHARYAENSFKFDDTWTLDETKRKYKQHIANILKRMPTFSTAWKNMPDEDFNDIFSDYFHVYTEQFRASPQVYRCDNVTDMIWQIRAHENQFRVRDI